MADTESVSETPVTDQRTDSARETDAKEESGTVLPLIFGGAFATALGFFAAQIDGVERALGLAEEDAGYQALIDAQADEIRNQSAQLLDLKARLDALPPAPEPTDLSGVEGSIAEQASVTAALESRLTEVEKRPMTENVSEDAIAAYEAELTRLQGTVEEQRAEVEALLEEARNTETAAERNAQIALARAAMTRIIAAVESGAPYSDAIADLQDAGGADVPPALQGPADKGVPTLAQIQSAFPAVAREALSASRSEAAASGNGGIGNFIQQQLGVRSVTPQEGDGADAVLSRVEAAVREGRIDDALAEADALPDVSKAVMADWFALAETRRAATAATDELMTALSAN